MKSKTLLRVRYGETDKMGVVHHSNYLKYFEFARIEWLRNLGISYLKTEKEGIILPVVKTEITFKKAAFFDDLLEIKVVLLAPPTSKIMFGYAIINQNKVLVCEGKTTLGFLDARSMRPIRCPQSISDKLKKEVLKN